MFMVILFYRPKERDFDRLEFGRSIEQKPLKKTTT